MRHHCPKCGYPQYCPCKACTAPDGFTPPGVKTWKWITGNGPIACGNCGFTASDDWWLDEEIYQLKMYSRYWTGGEYDAWYFDTIVATDGPVKVWRPSRTI